MRVVIFHEGRHLAESELFAPRGECPLCLSTAPRRQLHRIQDEPFVALLACPHCHGASASRMPKPEVLDGYYQDYYEGKDARVTTADPGRLAASIARRLGPTNPAGSTRVLDFGGGDGSIGLALGKLLLKSGAPSVELEVVDYDEPASSPSSALTAIGRRDIDDVEGSFDVVVASAVLEHIPEFNELFRRLVGLVSPGGSLYARTPWVAPFRRLPGGLDLTYPAHVHDLGGDFWNRVVATFGLGARLVRSGPSPVEAGLRSHPVRAGVAALLKLPARAEARMRKPLPRDPWWSWVGGWEAVLRRDDGRT